MDKIIFHDAAHEEYVESYVWYYERGVHIAEAFEHEMERALNTVLKTPDQYPVYVGAWRRVLLRRFPFGIIYKNQDGVVIVIAVMHTRRRPGYWEQRKLEVVPY